MISETLISDNHFPRATMLLGGGVSYWKSFSWKKSSITSLTWMNNCRIFEKKNAAIWTAKRTNTYRTLRKIYENMSFLLNPQIEIIECNVGPKVVAFLPKSSSLLLFSSFKLESWYTPNAKGMTSSCLKKIFNKSLGGAPLSFFSS